jgi:hypothetical protein
MFAERRQAIYENDKEEAEVQGSSAGHTSQLSTGTC